jgi:spore maturation protein SpmB
MKRRKEHLVLKRDGRMEFLRATKLARSIDQAMRSVGVDESWRALELANVVLAGLRQQSGSGAVATVAPMTTSAIADAVQHVLVATGQPNAAVAYGALGVERARRHRSLATLGRAACPTDTVARCAPVPGARVRRFGQE